MILALSVMLALLVTLAMLMTMALLAVKGYVVIMDYRSARTLAMAIGLWILRLAPRHLGSAILTARCHAIYEMVAKHLQLIELSVAFM